ncbi:hypothetical protein [Methylocystis sp.]|uniref:hypothetical protein n=1 Tax=Methylocystis sp. TaxID=1911079 RepID=UPI00260111E9|nr:hypothetical protein [Methylocystis sp.]
MLLIEPTTRAEEELLGNARWGKETDCSTFSSSEREVRSEFLRALMLGGVLDKSGNEPTRCIGAVKLTGAVISDRLDLSQLGHASVPLPSIIFKNCDIRGDVDLSGARIGDVELNNWTPPITLFSGGR